MNKGPCSPRDVPVLSVGKTRIQANQQLMRELSTGRRVRIEIQDGRPVLIQDPNGWTVTPSPRGVEYTGSIAAPAIMEKAKALDVGSRWVMEKRNGKWFGRPFNPTDYLARQGAVANGIPVRQLPVISKELVRRLLRTGAILSNRPERDLMDMVQVMSQRAWADIKANSSGQAASD